MRTITSTTPRRAVFVDPLVIAVVAVLSSLLVASGALSLSLVAVLIGFVAGWASSWSP
jgi:hypothetical protein